MNKNNIHLSSREVFVINNAFAAKMPKWFEYFADYITYITGFTV